MLRFQLINNKVGNLVIRGADPIGIAEITKTVKRSDAYEGAVFEVVFDVPFIKKGRRFLKECFETDGGIDAIVFVNIYYYDPNARRWKLYGQGKVNYNKYDVEEDRLTVTIEQTGFQTLILNLIERDVNVEVTTSQNGTALPGTFSFAMPYHSKAILKESIAVPQDFTEQYFEDVGIFTVPNLSTEYRELNIYGNVDTQKLNREELKEIFGLPFGFQDYDIRSDVSGPNTPSQTRDFLLANTALRFNFLSNEEAGKLTGHVKLNLRHHVHSNAAGSIDICGDGDLGNIELTYWFELRDANDNIVLLENIGVWDMAGCGGSDREGDFETHEYEIPETDTEVGWKAYVYSNVRIWGDYENNDPIGSHSVYHSIYIESGEDTSIDVKVVTRSPETTAKTFFIHDVFEKIVKYITGQNGDFDNPTFRSTLLGRPEKNYAEDGKYAMLTMTNGKNLRGVVSPLFTNFKDLFDFVNSITPIGFGFERNPNGTMRLVLEEIGYFYRDEIVFDLGKVSSVKRVLNSKDYINQIEFGYATKVDVSQANAIDEFNTLRKFNIPIVNTKNVLKISTKFVTGGYQIEAQRRLAPTTQDSKLDDTNFVVVAYRTGFSFSSKKSQGYEYILNVLDPDSGYNYDISPVSNLRNYFQVLAAGLIYSKNKTISFGSGEVNFKLITKKTGDPFIVNESGSYDLQYIDPLWDNFNYKFDGPLRDELFVYLNEHPYGYIKFEDQYGAVMYGWLSKEGIEHSNDKGMGTFTLLRKFNKTT